MWIEEKKAGVYKDQPPEIEDELANCMRCGTMPEELFSLKQCNHIFCMTCLEEDVTRDLDDDLDVNSDNVSSFSSLGAMANVLKVLLCPKCGKSFKDKHIKPYQHPAASASKSRAKQILSSNAKGKDESGRRPVPAPGQLCFSRWLEQIDSGKIDVMPCAKLVAIREQVRKWIKEAKKDKLIIFTQFRHFQTMLGCELRKHKIKFLYFSVSIIDPPNESHD